MPMPDFHLITAIDNLPVMGMGVTGVHTGFQNGLLMPDTSTLTPMSWEPGAVLVLCDTHDSNGSPVIEAPRTILRSQLNRLKERGLEASMSSELEFYLYKNNYGEVQEHGYRGLEPSYHRHADNDVLIAGYDEDFLSTLRVTLTSMGLPVWATQGEGGPGQHEVNLSHTVPLRSADWHVLYKHAVKAVAHQMDRSVTFMAKPSHEAGSGCHIHLSLSRNGQNALREENGELTATGRMFLAGLLNYTRDFSALHAPYANSYRRLQPDSLVPLNATWGFDNRTCLVRVLGQGEDFRFEFRLPGADANPYLVVAALVAAGLAGLDNEDNLPAPVSGNAGEADAPALPRDLTESIQSFSQSMVAQEALGASVHAHLLGMVVNERNLTRGAVTDWDLQRGFENA
jgi:glutamine synthetase